MGLYRKNVGIVVFNKGRKVFMAARADKPDMQWQFPQGGLEPGETVTEAAYRELAEETGIKSAQAVYVLPEALRYDLPQDVTKAFQKAGCPYTGQEQTWVLFYFCGDDSEIDFTTNPQEIEFKAYEWVDIDEAPKRIVAFKKHVYQTVAEAFKPIIEKNSLPR